MAEAKKKYAHWKQKQPKEKKNILTKIKVADKGKVVSLVAYMLSLPESEKRT